MNYADRDILTMARTLYGECRNQPWKGKIAVGWVILNRAKIDLHDDGKPDWWGEGIEGICLKSGQFSAWNSNDPNRDKMLAATSADMGFRDCLAATCAVLSESEPDPTEGATHYKVSTLPWPRDWGAVRPPLMVIAQHSFYRI